jgi:hypothetical protein
MQPALEILAVKALPSLIGGPEAHSRDSVENLWHGRFQKVLHPDIGDSPASEEPGQGRRAVWPHEARGDPSSRRRESSFQHAVRSLEQLATWVLRDSRWPSPTCPLHFEGTLLNGVPELLEEPDAIIFNRQDDRCSILRSRL